MNLVCFSGVVVLVFLCTVALPPSPYLAGIDIGLGFQHLFVLLCFVAFTLTYVLVRTNTITNRPESDLDSQQFTVSSLYMGMLAVLGSTGALVSFLQVQYTVGVASYYSMLRAGGRLAEEARGNAILHPLPDMGLPGVLRMFNTNAVTAVILLVTLLMAGGRIKGAVSRLCVIVVILAFLMRLMLHMDRLPLLALLPLLPHVVKRASRIRRSQVLVATITVLIVAEVISRNRGYSMGLIGFGSLYVQSGMVNLSYLLSTFSGPYSYGLQTLFTPALFFAKAIGSPFNFAPYYEWAWNPALNGFGYAFMEWGWFAFCVFAAHGAIGALLDATVVARSEVTPAALLVRRLQLLSSYLLLSYIAVPASSGPEFHLTAWTLGFAYLLERFMVRYATRRLQLSMDEADVALASW